ncbi:hypothetical protein BGZ51_006457 [Haplosporangium sp. Z 767]|nr:hypothetical protein BGZ51_006457 [Haplosporangium sp. Z 767]
MSSKHVDTRPKQPAKAPFSSFTPDEHLNWAVKWNTGKEHVTFPKFVIQFKFYDRTDAHRAYCSLLDSGKVKQQRLKNIRMEYEQFKKNKDDLFWSRRLNDKSTTIVVNNASVIVQEAGLKQVNSIIQRHFDRHEPNNTKADGQNRRRVTTTEISEDDMENHLFHGTEENEEGDDDEVALVNFKARTSGASLPGTASLAQNYRQGAERFHTVVLEGTGNSSNSDGDEPADTMNAPSHDQDNDSAGCSEESVTVEAAEPEHSVVEVEEPILGDTERKALLSVVEKASHRVCEWIVDGTCVACRFQEFQRACIESLVNNEIKKTEVADAMAIIGVFAPSMSTRRMGKAFSKKLLCALAKSTVELPKVAFDDSAMMKAVQLYIKGDKDNAADVLYSLPKKDPGVPAAKDLCTFESNPIRNLNSNGNAHKSSATPKPIDSISESTFVTKYIAPIIQAFVDNDITTSDFPNTESTTQKRQGLKADQPDIRAMVFEKEVCWGEVTGPVQETNAAKNQWDRYRLAHFGKAFLDEGHAMAPLIQVIYSQASYFRLSAKIRGLILLEEVGTFVIPTTTATIPSLFATIPTLLVAKADIQRISDGDLHGLKRSWGYKDLKNAKTRLM